MMISVSNNEPPVMPLVKELTEKAERCGGTLIIGTHDGSMHPDDVLAVAMIEEYVKAEHYQIIRSRDSSRLSCADVLVDVGLGRFDHHQEGNPCYSNGVPITAVGKVLAALEPSQHLINLLLWDGLYALQAGDAGASESIPKGAACSKFDWVKSFNPTWEESNTNETDWRNRFDQAVQISRKIFRRMRVQCLSRIHSMKHLAVAPTYNQGRFIMLPRGGMPWQQYAYRNRRLLGAYYEDVTGKNWVVRVAKENPVEPFTRVNFPAEWGGKSEVELQTISGIRDAIFCHKSLFIATFRTKAGAEHAMRILSSKYRLEHGGNEAYLEPDETTL